MKIIVYLSCFVLLFVPKDSTADVLELQRKALGYTLLVVVIINRIFY